jgi:KaiC/GvpD/RAD55 family RecA-like ATPase
MATLGLVVLVVAVAVLGSVAVFMKKRKPPLTKPGVAAQQARVVEEGRPLPAQPAALAKELSTGYGDLDRLLAGGLPESFGVMIVSPPCDERDLLQRKIIDSALSSGRPTFYVSSDPGRTQDLVGRYWKDFYALSPQADKIPSPPANLYKLPGIENLSDLNISFTRIMETHLKDPRANGLIILDILTDILLYHKALTTRKWLSDFLARRKAQGFTTLAFLNPLIASKEETQTVVDVFDGVIEIYEKALAERSRRFLVIRKMYGRRYSDSELMLDKDKLF